MFAETINCFRIRSEGLVEFRGSFGRGEDFICTILPLAVAHEYVRCLMFFRPAGLRRDICETSNVSKRSVCLARITPVRST